MEGKINEIHTMLKWLVRRACMETRDMINSGGYYGTISAEMEAERMADEGETFLSSISPDGE